MNDTCKMVGSAYLEISRLRRQLAEADARNQAMAADLADAHDDIARLRHRMARARKLTHAARRRLRAAAVERRDRAEENRRLLGIIADKDRQLALAIKQCQDNGAQLVRALAHIDVMAPTVLTMRGLCAGARGRN